jgi:signal peptidase I
MIGRFLRTHRAIYGDRDRVYHSAIGEDRGLSSPWLILGVGVIALGALDLWLFGGAPLFDDRITPYLPWNILGPQVVIWFVSVGVITAVMAVLGARTSPIIIARLWAYVMGHVATMTPPVLIVVLGMRSLLFNSAAIEVPAALMFTVIAVAVIMWLFAGLREIAGHHTFPAVVAVVLAFTAGIAIMDAKRRVVSRFYDIQSGSMRPAFDRGDRILTNSLMLMLREPRPGDVVVYTYREDRSDQIDDYVHRIVGGPGDRIAFAECGVVVNGRPARTGQREQSENPGIRTPQWTMPEALGGKAFQITFDDVSHPLCRRDEITVPPGYFFVAGDARDRSIDSRMPAPGLVPRKAITGIAIFVYASTRSSHRL